MKNKLTGFSENSMSAMKNSWMNGIANIKNSMTKFATENMRAIKGITDEVPILGRALRLLTNPYAMAAAAALSFGVATVSATSMALDWQKSMAKINVTAQLGSNELASLSKTILEIGYRGSTDLMQVPEAFNRIIPAVATVSISAKPALAAFNVGSNTSSD